MTQGFLMLVRGDKTRELMQYPNAWTLLSVIAYRARRSNGTLNPHKLELGEALIGDYENYGMTEKAYRVAKGQLEKWGIAAFKGANKGTVARLLDTSIYDLNLEGEGEQQGGQGADGGRTKGEQQGGQGATNEERNEPKNDKSARTEQTERRVNEQRNAHRGSAAPPDSRVSSVNAGALSNSARLGFAAELRKLLDATTKADLTALWNFQHWLDGSSLGNGETHAKVIAIARESATGRKPIAVFFSRIKAELGYRPRAERCRQA